jgi:peptide/nickel transport system substrate-binding protein
MQRFLTTAAVILTLAGPAHAQSAAEPALVVSSFFPADLNPAARGDFMTEYGAAQTLMQLRADGQFHPWLAQSVERVADTQWVVTLRPGINFQNGTPADAQAVADSMTHTLANSSGATGAVPEGFGVTATGELELTIDTGRPFPGLPGVLSRASFFTIYDVDAVATVGEDWAALAGQGIYTGPYEVESHSSEHWTLVRNDDYWEGTPGMDGLDVRLVPDANARVLSVQNGEADIALYPPTAAKPVVDATPGMEFSVGILDSRGFMMFLNSKLPPFDDVTVRKAVARFIDTTELAEVVFDGVFAPAESIYSPAFPYAVANQRMDRDEAMALLDTAGWAVGDDGIRSRDGAKLAITILIYPSQPDLTPMSTALQAQLRELGVEVSIRSVDDIAAAMADLDSWHGALSSSSFGNWGQPENFLSSTVVTGAPQNTTGYSNAEIDRLAGELAEELEPARQTELLAEIQDVLVNQDPFGIQLVFQQTRAIVNDRFAGFAPGFQNQFFNWQTAPAQ